MAYGAQELALYICNNRSEIREELGKTEANRVAR